MGRKKICFSRPNSNFFLANQLFTKTLSCLFGKKSFLQQKPKNLLPHHFFTFPPPLPAFHLQSFFLFFELPCFTFLLLSFFFFFSRLLLFLLSLTVTFPSSQLLSLPPLPPLLFLPSGFLSCSPSLKVASFSLFFLDFCLTSRFALLLSPHSLPSS